MRKIVTVQIEVETDSQDEEYLMQSICSCLAGKEFGNSTEGGPDDGKECEFGIISVSAEGGFGCDTDLARMSVYVMGGSIDCAH